MVAIKKKIKEATDNRLMISSDKEVQHLLEEFLLDRVTVGLARGLDEVMRVCKKKIVTAEHLKIALNGLSL